MWQLWLVTRLHAVVMSSLVRAVLGASGGGEGRVAGVPVP